MDFTNFDRDSQKKKIVENVKNNYAKAIVESLRQAANAIDFARKNSSLPAERIISVLRNCNNDCLSLVETYLSVDNGRD